MNTSLKVPALYLLASGFALLLGSCGCATNPCNRCDDPPSLARFDMGEFSPGKETKGYPYLLTKTGRKPLLLLHELPGLTAGTMDLSLDLQEEDYKVYTPKLFGKYGQNKGLWALPQSWFTGRWRTLSWNGVGPISDDTRSMVDQIGATNPGRSVTVIGNCFTGTLPLELISHSRVETSIICQPALPFVLPTSESSKSAWPISNERLDASIKAMKENRNKRLIFIQYADDKFAPLVRIKRILARLECFDLLKQTDIVVAANSMESARAAFDSESQRQRIHLVKVCDSSCHSTITGAQNPDRGEFRSVLLKLLSKHQ